MVNSSDVVAITGHLLSGSIKLSSSALPSTLSPVIRITYLGLSSGIYPAALTIALRIRSAWSISSQKIIVFANGSVAISKLMLVGKTKEEIASMLFISNMTVDTHIKNIY